MTSSPDSSAPAMTSLGGLPERETLQFDVYGTPAPQGSHKAFVRGNRAVVTDDSAKTRPWRQAVLHAALLAIPDRTEWPIIGPVAVRMVFTLPKPKGAPKRTRTLPAKRPDWDKLARSTGDAMTDAGVYRDDAQVIEATVRKVYPGEDADALSVPGARIWVSAVAA